MLLTMRPDLLNPLFAEIEVLKGVGAVLAKPLARLGLARVVDVLFHLPTGSVERTRVERLERRGNCLVRKPDGRGGR